MKVRNPYVVPMNERNRASKFGDRREERGGSKNEFLYYLLEYEEEKEISAHQK